VVCVEGDVCPEVPVVVEGESGDVADFGVWVEVYGGWGCGDGGEGYVVEGERFGDHDGLRSEEGGHGWSLGCVVAVSFLDLEHHVESMSSVWAGRGVSWVWKPYPGRVPAGLVVVVSAGDRVAYLGMDVTGEAVLSLEVVDQEPTMKQLVLESAHDAVRVLGDLVDWVVSG
jgi:hypothetical protein